MSYPINHARNRRDAVTNGRVLSDELRRRVAQLLDSEAPRYRRLWRYYRNPPLLVATLVSGSGGSERPYRMAQEWGLPSRITGVVPGGSADTLSTQCADGVARKEVVVENDIAWRIDTLVDYLFGKPIVINAAASDESRRTAIEFLLRAVIAHNGGIVLLQQLALLGAVYGFVDVLVKFDPRAATADDYIDASTDTASLGQPSTNDTNYDGNGPTDDGAGPSRREPAAAPDAVSGAADRAPVPPPAGPATGQPDRESSTDQPHDAPARDDTADPSSAALDEARLTRIARCIRLEVVEPARALPLVDPDDWRVVNAYAQVYCVNRTSNHSSDPVPALAKRTWFDRVLSRFSASGRGSTLGAPDETLVIDLITADDWKRYENERLVAHGLNALGRIPLVHIQNTSVPFEYPGASDVEPLLPLQDELNTRLSDRAHRVALQSFKMYLGKGIENFGQLPVAPGRMWMTDNEQAEVVEFGGDASCPSESEHISDIREAMDKTSGVTPIAAGALKGRVGRLTSAAALRITLLALLAKTERKRTTYGIGVAQVCELALAWLDVAGLFHTSPDERRIEINWPSPIPENDAERLADAEAKLRLGIDRDTVLRELGY